ncbi:MAG: phosphoribosylglycinamide formyltransferase [Oscillospiraceae bacterium]|nr:phosphoribosylglycinamide formyltransferase [Oscillospiraceae bacterium]
MTGVRIAVLVSGGGTNLKALIDAEKRGELGGGKITLVVSSNSKAYALTRAKQNGIEAVTVSKKDYGSTQAFDKALLDVLAERKIELVVLAGYLCIVGENVLKAFSERIINVHPSLIPSFCGKGYYGLKVHEEALRYGVKVTGATVHHVSGVIDGGRIILQKAVEVQDGDTPEILQKRVMDEAEQIILPKAVEILSFKMIKENACEGVMRQ